MHLLLFDFGLSCYMSVKGNKYEEMTNVSQFSFFTYLYLHTPKTCIDHNGQNYSDGTNSGNTDQLLIERSPYSSR